MDKKEMNHILKILSDKYHVPPEQIYREMQEALDIGQASDDPTAQARWRSIPHKGEKVTVEEFLKYMHNLLSLTQ